MQAHDAAPVGDDRLDIREHGPAPCLPARAEPVILVPAQ